MVRAVYAQKTYEQRISSFGDRGGNNNGGRTDKEAPAC
ncbi:hypothetical protein COO91_02798 [Nostoc flagelliforme CCNUN1]|uniref:Uncharacterized protein n=1 Tax=Nostoc flagelliforme CCNUN1 TaxID=2038116 RepID=A0A2K8SNI8_9NOSO|nr:hypothetical protein COO91_02798 [Nostoc flagelliforme CCNUN1]